MGKGKRTVVGAIAPTDVKYWYNGVLSLPKMEPEAKRAYKSWSDQKSRCYNTKDPGHKYYGNKGIVVKYSSREFVGWWLKIQSELKLKTPTVGRIDHDSHYMFSNIKLEEKSENIAEKNKRNGNIKFRKKCVCFDFKSKEALMIFDSLNEAASVSGVANQSVSQLCLRKKNHFSANKYTFRYLSDYLAHPDKLF